MKNLKKRLVAAGLAAVLALGLAAPAMAYTTPDFSDLPADNWAYDSVMRMADAGVIQGTGEGRFSPEMKVSVAQFLTLVGRIVFPDTVVTEADTWYGPHIVACQNAGFLSGTQVDTDNVEAEISRYDMAVVLRAAAKELGKAETLAQQSQVTDFGVIPNMYTEAVLAVYGMGLITGDQNGNFNGSNTMMRNELATVIDRLVALKAPGGVTTGPEKPAETETPDEAEPIHIALRVSPQYALPLKEAPSGTGGHMVIRDQFPIQICYTEDAGKTATVLAEGLTSYFSGDPSKRMLLEFDVTEEMIQSGEFYVSGEVNYEVILYATHDRRTDGHAQIVPFDVKAADRAGFVDIEVVPPATGVWRTVTLNQYYGRWHIKGNLKAQCRYYSDPESVTPDGGVLLAEALVDEEGYYHLEFKIDSIDYDVALPAYKIYIFDADTGELVGNGTSLASLRELTSAKGGTIE